MPFHGLMLSRHHLTKLWISRTSWLSRAETKTQFDSMLDQSGSHIKPLCRRTYKSGRSSHMSETVSVKRFRSLVNTNGVK